MKKLSYEWHLRTKMAEHGMFATTDLHPHLADRGITLSREQVYRLVTGKPQRMSMDILCALCDILECTPNDLVELTTVEVSAKRVAGQNVSEGTVTRISPRRTQITRPGGDS